MVIASIQVLIQFISTKSFFPQMKSQVLELSPYILRDYYSIHRTDIPLHIDYICPYFYSRNIPSLSYPILVSILIIFKLLGLKHKAI